MIDPVEITAFLKSQAPGAGVAGVGGFMHYLYKVRKGEVFSFTKMAINIVLAGWIGYICQELGLSGFYISIAGFCAYPLLGLIESKFPEIMLKILESFITKK